MRAPFAAILAGCVIPDLPWILRRLIDATGIALEPITAYAYFIVQASLVGCLLPSIAFGLFFRSVKFVAAFALLGSLLHLLLDSLQDKWGVGVHLLAPYNWETFQPGIFELDSRITYLISFAGIVPFLLIARVRHDARLVCVNSVRLAACCVCLIAYLFIPFLFISDVVASNSRYLQTLENQDERGGKFLELDRETASVVGDTWYTTTHVGEILEIVNPDANMKDGDTYSFKAEFRNDRQIRLIDMKRHSGTRDIASYIGLLAIGCWMAVVLMLSKKPKSAGIEKAG
jgi:hypothetical protein